MCTWHVNRLGPDRPQAQNSAAWTPYSALCKTSTMTPSSDENDFHSIVHSKCFELTKMLGSKGMAFTFKLTLGESFCFSLDTMGARIHPAPVPAKKKKKSESAKRRDKKRRLEFLSRKKTVSSPGALSACANLLLGLPESGSPLSCDPRSRSSLPERHSGYQQIREPPVYLWSLTMCLSCMSSSFS